MQNENENEITIKELKDSLDIIEVAEMYGELVKAGANYKYVDDTSITFNATKQIFTNWNGDTKKGLSVLDLIMYMEKIDLPKAINRMKELSNLNTYNYNPIIKAQRKKESEKKKIINFESLNNFANNNLKSCKELQPFIRLIQPKTNLDDPTLYYDEVLLKEEFVKLFETDTFCKKFEKGLSYIFNHLVGYDKHWRCPSIIIRDDGGKVVDYIAYRPKKPQNYDNWSEPKYIYKNSHDRGKNFLYPFRKEIEHILKDKPYMIIGEGIKNGLNALLYSIPFVSVESTSSTINKELIEYIRNQDKNIITMFDGDLAGARAYLKFISSYLTNTAPVIKEFLGKKHEIEGYIKFIKECDFKIKNYFDFNSGVDFVEYMQGSK